VTGRPLAYRALAERTYRGRLAGAGAPAWLAEAFCGMFAAVRDGRFADVTADVAELTGRAPAAYEDAVRAWAAGRDGPVGGSGVREACGGGGRSRARRADAAGGAGREGA
jgi:hypothetical protein